MTDMNKQTEALKLAEDALKRVRTQDMELVQLSMIALAAIREAQASEAKEQPAPVAKPRKQEPVKWSSYEPDGTHHNKPAQSKQKPLAWLKAIDTPGGWGKFVEAKPHEKGAKPVYTSPPIEATPLASQRSVKPWVGLTEFDIDQIPYSCSHADSRLIAYAIEAKLREKNT